VRAADLHKPHGRINRPADFICQTGCDTGVCIWRSVYGQWLSPVFKLHPKQMLFKAIQRRGRTVKRFLYPQQPGCPFIIKPARKA
jgi:hypothetical protein